MDTRFFCKSLGTLFACDHERTCLLVARCAVGLTVDTRTSDKPMPYVSTRIDAFSRILRQRYLIVVVVKTR